MKQYCGITTLVGASNAGKSSLLNAFARAPLAEVHRKRNLTREIMRAVVTADTRQLVLEDTAGLNAEANDEIGTRRKEQSLSAARCADLALWIVDAARGQKAVEALLERVRKQEDTQAGEQKSSTTPSPNLFVALNKVDLVKDKRLLLPLAHRLGSSDLFRDVFMLSATSGDGIDRARETLLLALPEAPFLYEHEGDTRPPALVACETTRAALFERLHDELPYDILVESEQCEQHEDGAWHIALAISLRRESQRQILLVHDARLLHAVKKNARYALQKRFAAPVSLQLHLPRARQR